MVCDFMKLRFNFMTLRPAFEKFRQGLCVLWMLYKLTVLLCMATVLKISQGIASYRHLIIASEFGYTSRIRN